MSGRDGGPAFPSGVERDGPARSWAQHEGMTLRDYFAAAALTGFTQHQEWIGYVEAPAPLGYQDERLR